MRAVRLGVFLALATVVALAGVVGASLTGVWPGTQTVWADTVTGTWASSIQVQNMESTVCYATLRFTDKAGIVVATQSIVIGAKRSKTLLPGWPTDGDADPNAQYTDMRVPSSFDGSVLIEASTRIAAVTNVNTTSYSMADNYNGVDSSGRVVYLPLVQRQRGNTDRWSTRISVQNATASPLTATVHFYSPDGVEVVAARTALSIPANGRADLDQDTQGSLPTNWFGSARIDTGNDAAQVAAVVVQSNGQSVISYPGYVNDRSAAVLYAPLIQNENDSGSWWSGIQVMNVSNVPTQIAVEIATLVGSTYQYQTVSTSGVVGQNQAFNWLTAAPNSGFAGKPPVIAARFRALDSNARLIGLVNLNRRDVFTQGAKAGQSTGAPVLGSGYRMSTAGRQQAYAPLVDYYNDNWWAGLNIMNVGSTATNVQLYVNGSAVGSRLPLRAGEGYTYFRPSDWGLTGTGRFVASAYVEADGGGSIIGVLSRQRFASGKENALVYEAIPQ
ncbi:MAG: hypothetical protein ACYC4L_03790 [Chloroflexota bacterium]